MTPGGFLQHTPVLIAGGGPAGLAAAAELAFHGVASTVIEPRPTVSALRPRAKTTSVRTMEHFRRWGIADTVRAAAPLKPDWSDQVIFCRSLDGEVVTSFANAFGLGPETLEISPERGQQIPQPLVEEVLREHVQASPLVTLRLGSRLTALTQAANEVTATIEDEHGLMTRFSADYLIGCDGASGNVRKAIGVRYEGTSDVRPNFNFLFTAPDLNPPRERAVQYWVVGGPTPLVAGRLDLKDTWWAIVPGMDEQTGVLSAGEIIANLVGRPIPHTIMSTDSWTARLLIAEQFQLDRVFLAGESAHLNPPWGGHGFNTSIGDAVNIGWKLAAVLNGWAHPDLLNTYEAERRPIAQQTIDAAQANMRALPQDLATTAKNIQVTKDAEFHSMGLVLGYSYGQVAEPSTEFTARVVPGGRLPHVWLDDGRAFFDELGPEYTLIAQRPAELQEVVTFARANSIPLKIIEPPQQYPWKNHLLLVRPDQHLAAVTSNPLEILGALQTLTPPS
jgi:2-polyprenyl-6-methoxyphenol hydroxylase-like FAD-dependent oxidoreductase